MKKRFIVFILIITIIAFAGGGVVALALYADDIIYNPSNSEFKVSDAQGALDELYELVDEYGSAGETIINNFSGNQLVVNHPNIGRNAPGNVAVSNSISPKIFSKITVGYAWWYGSGSGNYPWCEPYNPQSIIYLVDADSGETVYSKTVYGRPGTLEIDLSSYTNDVILKVNFQTGGYSTDCTGQAVVNTVYCTIK